jgi:hypothetical protein
MSPAERAAWLDFLDGEEPPPDDDPGGGEPVGRQAGPHVIH